MNNVATLAPAAAKPKSTCHQLRKMVESDLAEAKGKPTNISSPGYRFVQALAAHLDGGQVPTDRPELKDGKSIRSGVTRETELSLILSAAQRLLERRRTLAQRAG